MHLKDHRGRYVKDETGERLTGFVRVRPQHCTLAAPAWRSAVWAPADELAAVCASQMRSPGVLMPKAWLADNFLVTPSARRRPPSAAAGPAPSCRPPSQLPGRAAQIADPQCPCWRGPAGRQVIGEDSRVKGIGVMQLCRSFQELLRCDGMPLTLLAHRYLPSCCSARLNGSNRGSLSRFTTS